MRADELKKQEVDKIFGESSESVSELTVSQHRADTEGRYGTLDNTVSVDAEMQNGVT